MRDFLIVLLFLPLFAGAQLRFGVKAGVNQSEMSNAYRQSRFDPSSIFGYHAGVTLDYGSTPNLFVYFQPLITLSGGKWFLSQGMVRAESGRNDVDAGYRKYEIYSLRLPVGVKYSFTFGKFRPFICGAPYIDFGLVGLSKVDWKSGNSNVYKSEWGALNRFSYGASLGLGAEFEKIFVSFDYQKGLSNMASDDGLTVKMNTSLLSVGFYFN